MKHTTLLSFFTFLFFIFSAQTSAADAVHWDSSTHVDHYVDANGDGVKDLLLQAVDDASSNALYFGSQLNFGTQYDTEQRLALEADLDGLSWSADKAQITIGFFNDDIFEDALVALPGAQKAYLLMGGKHGFVSFRRFDATQLLWLGDSEEAELYSGDFNGDGQSDLLVLMSQTGAHQVYHSQPDGKLELAQKRDKKSRWGMKKTEKLYIADFDGDGRDDVFALSKKKHKKHYIAYANKKGIFKRKNTQKIKADFAGYEWTDDGFSTALEEEGGQHYLVRLYNQNGGEDEEGRFIPDATDKLRHERCKYVYFMPKSKQAGTKCELKRKKRKKYKKRKKNRGNNAKADAVGIASASHDVTAMSATAGVMTSSDVATLSEPDELTTPPVSSVGAYPAVGQPFELSWAAVPNATRYEIWVSYPGSQMEYTNRYTSALKHRIVEHSEGGRFYYIKACNAQGCSSASPYKSVYVFNIPQFVTQFVASSDTVVASGNGDDSVTLSWSRPDGLIGSGGYYKILQIEPNGIQSWAKIGIPSTTTSQTVKLSGVNGGAGQYTYKIYSCNKTNAYCSGPSPYEVRVTLLPLNDGKKAVISNLSYTPVVASVGITQTFSFKYLDSSWCRSHNYSDNSGASVTYIGGPNETRKMSGTFSWSAYRSEPATWAFDVTCSNNVGSSTQHVSTIITANKKPIAYDDQKTVAYGEGAVVIRVLDNDVDADGHALTISSFTQPSVGTVTCSNKCTYAPPASGVNNAQTSFNYTVNDGWGGNYTAQVEIRLVSPIQDPVVTLAELQYAPQVVTVGQSQTFSFTYTDVRECKNNLGVVYVPNNGQLQSGTYVWGPILRDSPAVWDFSVTCSNNNSSVTRDVYGRIDPNEGPQATPDTFSVLQYTQNNLLSVLNNDIDANNLGLTVVQVTQPLNATVTITPDGDQVSYTPNADFVGTESFVYTIEDGWGNTSQSTVTVTVGEVPSGDPSLIAEYLFEDASNLAYDSSGRGNHATIDRLPVQGEGKIGKAMYTRNGAIKELPGFDKRQLVTINFWFKTDSNREFLYLMHQGYWDGGYPAWEFRPEILASGPIHFVTLGDNNVVRDLVYFYDRRKNYRDGRWHMMTIITDGTFMEGFMDGVQSGLDTSISGPDDWSADQPKSAKKVGSICYYGNDNCRHGYQYFDGAIDNYRMYNRALSREEITALYNEKPKPVNHPPSGEVDIVGQAGIGLTVSSDATTLNDVDGLGIFSYQWHRHQGEDVMDIGGATGPDYTVSEADVGHALSVTVSYIDGLGKRESMTSGLTPAVSSNLPPSISLINDIVAQEDTEIAPIPFIVEDIGASQSELLVSVESDAQSILPQTGITTTGDGAERTLTLVPAENAHGEVNITVTVSDGSLSNEVDFTLTIEPVNDAPTGRVVITGDAEIGSVLTADTQELVDEDGLGELSYQWKRGGNDIAEATLATYTVTQDDDGKLLTVEVSYTDEGGEQEQMESASVYIGEMVAGDWGQLGGEADDATQVSKTASASDFNGATPAQAGVSGGAASYHIPIVIPPGRNGVQPNVALNYS
ncbi:Ig-like domain-containing protein, partial [Alteromonas sp. a30]|uniref:Ig-like domain-containing protein n=1 Tax=Alteromonas sp. a30 TaxID=2730917 RepID=UPI002281E3DF